MGAYSRLGIYFSAFIMSAYSRWVLIRGWELILINTVVKTLSVGAGLTRL